MAKRYSKEWRDKISQTVKDKNKSSRQLDCGVCGAVYFKKYNSTTRDGVCPKCHKAAWHKAHPMKKKFDRKCEVCGEMFKSKNRVGKTTTCSSPCSLVKMRGKPTQYCATCGRPMYHAPKWSVCNECRNKDGAMLRITRAGFYGGTEMAEIHYLRNAVLDEIKAKKHGGRRTSYEEYKRSQELLTRGNGCIENRCVNPGQGQRGVQSCGQGDSKCETGH